MISNDRWTVADEQFEVFLELLQTHAGRMTRVRREVFRPTAAVLRERAYDEETERLRRYLAGAAA